MKKILNTSNGLVLEIAPLYMALLFLVSILPLILGYFELPITVVNGMKVVLGLYALMFMLKDITIKKPVFYLIFFLILNIFYYLFFQSYDERATGKLLSILLVGMTFCQFYFVGKSNWASEGFFKKLFIFMLVVVIFVHFKTMGVKRFDRGLDDVVVNTSYIFTYLLPFVFFFRSKIKSILLIVLIFLMVVLGGKRGAIVALSCGVMVWFYFAFITLRGSKRKNANRLLFGFFTTAFILATIIYFLSKFPFVKQRLFALMGGEGGSGREIMYKNIFEGWINAESWLNILFGFGFSASKKFTGNNLYAHNDWLEVLINFGAFGVIIYAFFWLLCIKLVRQGFIERYCKFQIISIIVICLMASLFSMVYSASASASIAIGLLGYQLGRNERYESRLND